MSDITAKTIVVHGVPAPGLFDRFKRRKIKDVVVLEGRPTLDAGKENCRALLNLGIVPTLIADNMAGFLFARGLVQEVWLAYQSCGEDGLASDIGGLILAVLGKRHRVPVFAYPSKRKEKVMGKPKDLTTFRNVRIAPAGVPAYVPLLEWVPKTYLKGIYES